MSELYQNIHQVGETTTSQDKPGWPSGRAMLDQPAPQGSLRCDGWLGLSLTPELMRHFPKPCRPRKAHHCRLCAGKIEVGEQCCKWEYLEPGEGYGTSHAHPECYQVTLAEKWDEGDWECASPGDVTRPNRCGSSAPTG